MTYREKLAKEHPDRVNPNILGGCERCPHSYGYEPRMDLHDHCRKTSCDDCWDREIPEEKSKERAETSYREIPRKIRVLPEVRHSQVINIETEEECRRILGDLKQMILIYGRATMADLKDICGLSTDIEDREIGWTFDVTARRIPDKDGDRYTITLPVALPFGDTDTSDSEEPSKEARDETNPVYITIHTNHISDPDAVIADVFTYAYTIKDRVVNISIQ